ncbi:MAG: DNA methyltransferase [Pseudonocardiaceae bacterium]
MKCWYAKTIDYYGSQAGRWAFVSTNSICQGAAVEFLWRPILESGWRCRFAPQVVPVGH